MVNIKKCLQTYGKTEVESLAKYTTWKVGGSALCFEPDSIKKLLESMTILNDTTWKILGGGSNVLFSDSRLRSIVLRLTALEFKAIKFAKDNTVYCGAGVSVSELLRFMRKNKLSCVEFLAGLPASIGGLIQMNASFKNKSIADILDRIVIIDQQYMELKEIDVKKMNFSYRHSGLEGQIIVGAFLRTQDVVSDELEELIQDCIFQRSLTQEWGTDTAGCVFKNPELELSAGKLIDKSGLKGVAYGDAMISKKHANFIVNRGNARSSDIVYLINKIKDTVYKKNNILLEEEIIRIEC